MKITKTTDNGNITTFNKSDIIPQKQSITDWISTRNNTESIHLQDTNNVQFNSNTIYCMRKNTDSYNLNNINSPETESFEAASVNVELVVCNRQYRVNTQNHNFPHYSRNKEIVNLEPATDIRGDNLIESPNAYSDATHLDEERAFDQSDTDEMSDNYVLAVPRGIVNPNYPGFQHLAHTLQDYSSNIENFYQSENEMTDDDADIEITELTLEPDCNQFESIEYKNIKNNNNNCASLDTQGLYIKNRATYNTSNDNGKNQNDIPDLLKIVPKNNNNVDEYYDSHCTEADIENNFNTKDIIGNFNKEVEDEIRHLLNYNISIQDDLKELRKDIKETFAKPIEKTINNISEVVNDVIKKLVETQSEVCDRNEEKLQYKGSYQNLNNKEAADEIIKINKENEKNLRTEMNLSRPTFLLIENNTDSRITDAFLSDGKDEINISEYDTEKLTLNVENTIKQLSTELRKIIPKLDQMRERDRLWAESKKDTMSILRDGNCNEIERSSKCYNFVSTQKNGDKRNINYYDVRSRHVNSEIDCRGSSDQQEIKKCYSNAQNKSVLMSNTENVKDIDLDSFDVYNIETALPKLDFDAIENHLKAAKEAERRKRNDREEIRRRLAMGADADEYYSMGYTDRPGKKPSLHSRLQSGMNLQICFMNETASDNESQGDIDKNVNYNIKSFAHSSIFSKTSTNHPYQTRPLSVNITKHDKISTSQSGVKLRPSSLMQKNSRSRSSHSLGHIELKESDFYALQATLQTEARIALAQAKEMARIQMECERRNRPVSPVTEMLRRSMEKANIPLAADRRRVSRQLLTDMNIAQLQVIVNELHSQIESLNDSLVKLLMARDELHMGQDSMLVDIEDLTRYFGVKEQNKKTKGSKSGIKKLTSLVHK